MQFFFLVQYIMGLSDSIKFLNLKIPRQCSIFCHAVKNISVFLIKNGIYMSLCIFYLINFFMFIISVGLVPVSR